MHKETTMPMNDSNKNTETSTPHMPSAPDGKSDLPTTLPDFPGPQTTPPPSEVQSTTATE
jgi:hypothetical protein